MRYIKNRPFFFHVGVSTYGFGHDVRPAGYRTGLCDHGLPMGVKSLGMADSASEHFELKLKFMLIFIFYINANSICCLSVHTCCT